MYRQILVPLDGSSFAEAALPYALAVSRRAGSAVGLVSVEEPDQGLAYDEWATVARQWSLNYLEDMAGRIRDAAGGPVTTTLLQGNVPEALVLRAAEGGADLVVMATHGRGVLSRAWLGSVADAFVRRTDRPVLLVRPGEDDEPVEPRHEVALDRILVPLDGSEFSRSILEPAVALGSLFGARYHLIRVLAFPTELASPYLPHSIQMNVDLVDEARGAALASLEGVAAELRLRGLEADVEVVVDPQAAHAILRRAGELDVGLVALATHGRSGAARLVLGSTTDKVIRGAQRPVLVLRPEGSEQERP